VLDSRRVVGHSALVTTAVDEWDRVRGALDADGVSGAGDFGRFVNDTTNFRPSAFDERGAAPTLLLLLPSLTDGRVVVAVAGHLRRPWARPTAFVPLHVAFRSWAARDWSVGWSLGDALVNAADESHDDELLTIANERDLGKARQMIVHSLWRFRKDQRVAMTLEHLVTNVDVALHAASALRRSVGNERALEILTRARGGDTDPAVRQVLDREIKKARKASA
jgi:hypothetical protein